MPRITNAEVAAAIALYPFAHEVPDASAPHLFANLAEPLQVAIAKSIAKDRAAGLSGADLRAKYSGPGCPTNRGLSGPVRRKVLRDYGFGSVIARSYETYSDGEPRSGSAHAKEHGAKAAERQAEALRQVEADARKAELAAMRKAVRAATGKAAPRKEADLRAAYAALQAEGSDA